MHGSLESTALGVEKLYVIYLPDGYDDSAVRYPVIYQVHGWGVTERKWSSPELNLPAAADAMGLQAIVVMPDGDRGVYVNSVTPADYEACLNEVTPKRNPQERRTDFCVRTPNYDDYMTEDLIPHIDRSYRTNPDREARAISGESAGGMAAMHLAIRHQSLFSSAASHSGGLSILYDGPVPYVREEAQSLIRIEPRKGFEEWEAMFGLNIDRWRSYDPYSLLPKLKDGQVALYLDCGKEDEFGFYAMAQHFHDRLHELAIRHTFKTVSGGHNDNTFRKQMPHGLKFHAKQFIRAGVYPQDRHRK